MPTQLNAHYVILKELIKMENKDDQHNYLINKTSTGVYAKSLKYFILTPTCMGMLPRSLC